MDPAWRARCSAIAVAVLCALLLAFRSDSVQREQLHPLQTSSSSTATTKDLCKDVETSLRTQQGFIFIKTHKTASSTLSGLLWRKLCGLEDYNCFLPQYANPGKIWSLTKDWNLIKTSLGSKNGTFPFDAWLHHVYFSRQLFDVVPSARILVSIVRRPSMRFRSAWSWYGHESKLKMPLHTFIDKVVSKQISPCGQYFKHIFQCYDFKYRTGLDATTEELLGTGFTKYSQEFIIQFDKLTRDAKSGKVFLLVADRFDQSLVVLAKFMRWPLHHLLYLSKKVLSSNKNSSATYLSEDTLRKADTIQIFDALLYKTANIMLDKYIDCFGKDVIGSATDRFQKAQTLLASACVDPADENRKVCEELGRDNRDMIRHERSSSQDRTHNEYSHMMTNLERFFV